MHRIPEVLNIEPTPTYTISQRPVRSFCQRNLVFFARTCSTQLHCKVHGDVHGYLGGAFGCNTDMDAFSQDHPEYSTRLLSFVLEHMAFAFWPTNAFLPSANDCDTECTRGQAEPCGCTCTIDAFDISDDEVSTDKVSSYSRRLMCFKGSCNTRSACSKGRGFSLPGHMRFICS